MRKRKKKEFICEFFFVNILNFMKIHKSYINLLIYIVKDIVLYSKILSSYGLKHYLRFVFLFADKINRIK